MVYSWMGHKNETRLRLSHGEPARIYRRFHKLGDQIRDRRYPPYWGG